MAMEVDGGAPSAPLPGSFVQPDDGANGSATSNPPRELAPVKVNLYQLLIRQLQDDGLVAEAQSISQHLHIQPDNRVGPDALLEAYGRSLKWAFGDEPQGGWQPVECAPIPPIAADEKVLDFSSRPGAAGGGAGAGGAPPGAPAGAGEQPFLSAATQARRPPEARVLYTSHCKQACRSVVFSPEGRFCATGHADGSIRVLDCARMRGCAANVEGPLARMRVSEEEQTRPVTRTLHDHQLGITCLAFHPTNPTLFSGSLDKAVKIFDLTRPTGHKKAFSILQDVHPVRSINIHPCGDFLLVGTAHQAVRLYDLQTLNCFTAFHQDHHHGAGINDVRHSSDGRVFASASSDGSIHIWDAVSNRIINRLQRAHTGVGVTSLRWSRNLRYLLSSGLDGRHRIWDVRTGAEVFSLGFGPRSCDYSTAVFASGEKYVVGVNSNWQTSDTAVFDAHTGSTVFLKLGLHQNHVRALDSSPVDKTVMTGCDDDKARYISFEDPNA
eukprot:TRINITY_DN54021_c0_g1_i4.p1 TRINITY_DN54021_c0_g1~~TRINITY_DN54021_c0_g1_i4.p1  ORF type:complete len:533 (-),score=88.35 TRINITY_DN54021_c0_g1_i4:190-1677(-)